MKSLFSIIVRVQRLLWALQAKIGRMVDTLDWAMKRKDGHLPVTEKQTTRRITAWHRDSESGLLCKATYETGNRLLIARLLSLPTTRVGRYGTIAVYFGNAEVSADLKEMITSAERNACAKNGSAQALPKANKGGLLECRKVAKILSN